MEEQQSSKLFHVGSSPIRDANSIAPYGAIFICTVRIMKLLDKLQEDGFKVKIRHMFISCCTITVSW